MNGVSLHWYRELWDASIMNDFKPPLGRSFLLALACAVTTCLLSVASAQAMRGRFRGHNLFFYLILLGIMAPGLLVGFGFALLCRLLGVETAWNTTAFLVHVSWTLPFGFLTMLAIFNRFDPKLEEAALTLGADRWTTFRRITLPIVMPGVIGSLLFGFSLSYDEFARSMFTTGADITLPLAVMAQLDRQLTPELYAIGAATTLDLAAGDPGLHRSPLGPAARAREIGTDNARARPDITTPGGEQHHADQPTPPDRGRRSGARRARLLTCRP